MNLKKISGYNNYVVDDEGNVYNVIRNKRLTPRINSDGYGGVYLYENGKGTNYRIHRLVAQAFIPNPNNYKEVNHKDHNPMNNHVDNLEWCDYRYNTNYGTSNKRRSKVMTNGKLSKPVFQYTKTGDFIREWPSISEINRQLGYDVGNISHCCLGNTRLKTYKGYKWKYKE